MSQRSVSTVDRQFDELSYADCVGRLQTKRLGRLAVMIGHYPQIFPVNYEMDDNIVVLRTHLGVVHDAANHGNVGFEVDHVDPSTGSGWSVLVQGMAEDVTDREGDAIADRSRRLPVEPWVPGEQPRILRIIPAHIGGRSLGSSDLGRPIGASDLGRRIAQRRKELSLSPEQLESAAGLGSGYVLYLETASAPNAGVETLHRLASALHITSESLSGGDLDSPPGRQGAVSHAQLTSIGAQECMALLGDRGVGRIVFVSDRGPTALPVNYTVVQGDVLFRTATNNSIATETANAPVSFEVDRIDETSGQGWSVLLTGELRPVSEHTPGEDPVPWAGGDRPVLLRLFTAECSGRRIV